MWTYRSYVSYRANDPNSLESTIWLIQKLVVPLQASKGNLIRTYFISEALCLLVDENVGNFHLVYKDSIVVLTLGVGCYIYICTHGFSYDLHLRRGAYQFHVSCCLYCFDGN